MNKIAFGDFNGDGVDDLALALVDTTTVGITLANSTPVERRIEIDVTTVAAAQEAMVTLQDFENRIILGQGVVGAYLSRLEVTSSLIEARNVQLNSAYARIMDINVAEETAKLLRLQILQQAATAITAQANLSSQRMVSLLLGTGVKR